MEFEDFAAKMLNMRKKYNFDQNDDPIIEDAKKIHKEIDHANANIMRGLTKTESDIKDQGQLLIDKFTSDFMREGTLIDEYHKEDEALRKNLYYNEYQKNLEVMTRIHLIQKELKKDINKNIKLH